MKKEIKSETSLIMSVTAEFISRRIFIIRGIKVILAADLAELYQVPTKQLNRAVMRNINRFPEDFMFQLTKDEASRCQFGTLVKQEDSRFQTGTLKKGQNIKYLPYAFTELGVAMLSSVLNSDRAVQMNIYIMRAFVKLREIMATNTEIAEKIKELEKGHRENKEHIIAVASALKKMMSKRPSAIGFVVDNKDC